jgi:hypothetical protein
VRIFELTETELGVGLRAVRGDHIGDGPVVVVGDQDPFAEDLVFQGGPGVFVDVPGQVQIGGGVAGQIPGQDPPDPGIFADPADLGGHGVFVAAGLAAGETLGERGQPGLGLGEGLVQATGLPGVQSR